MILSGYESELYNDTLQGWVKIHERVQAENGAPRVETLWLNYEQQEGMEDMGLLLGPDFWKEAK